MFSSLSTILFPTWYLIEGLSALISDALRQRRWAESWDGCQCTSTYLFLFSRFVWIRVRVEGIFCFLSGFYRSMDVVGDGCLGLVADVECGFSTLIGGFDIGEELVGLFFCIGV